MKSTDTQKSLKERTLQAATLPPKFRKLLNIPLLQTTPLLNSQDPIACIIPWPLSRYSHHTNDFPPCPQSKNILSYHHKKTIPCHPYGPMKNDM